MVVNGDEMPELNDRKALTPTPAMSASACPISTQVITKAAFYNSLYLLTLESISMNMDIRWKRYTIASN